jgi:hypothetical protein
MRGQIPPLVGYGLHALVFDWTGSAETGKIVPRLRRLRNSWINRLSCRVPGDFDIRSRTGFSPCPEGLPLLLLSTNVNFLPTTLTVSPNIDVANSG